MSFSACMQTGSGRVAAPRCLLLHRHRTQPTFNMAAVAARLNLADIAHRYAPTTAPLALAKR